MLRLKQTIRTIAATNSTVIVSGESGTGKELVARAIHTCSPRSGEPFVSVNCGAFPETLLESELFGYVKGAFTGANANKRGLFELANGGTIFLDEIGETTLPMQVKLLRVLQERCIRPVGGGQESPVDVRVIAATNRNLLQQVQEGRFREDLYYRLSVIPVEVPPLRDRGDDVVLLANHFLKKFAVQMGKKVVRLSPESLKTMKGYDWPGNVRVLENTIERAVAVFNPMTSNDEELRVELPKSGNGGMPSAAAMAGAPGVVLPADGIDLERYVADIEKSLLQSALRRSNGTQTRAAELLKLSYRSFRHMMKKYDLA
jgi:two-component system response regulator PilR (NtrC family)